MDVSVTIPDIGYPGTATPAQVAAVEKLLGTTLDFRLSGEQAHLLLAARDFSQAIMDTLAREGRPLHRENLIVMVARITRDHELRDYVGKWSSRRFARGSDPDNPRLRRNEHFFAVVDAGIRSGL